MGFGDLAINTFVKSKNVRKPQTHAFPYKGLSSYQHLSTNKITHKPQMEMPPFHSCTISCVRTILLLSFLWYVFYGGGDTHTGTSGHAKRKIRKEGERERGRGFSYLNHSTPLLFLLKSNQYPLQWCNRKALLPCNPSIQSTVNSIFTILEIKKLHR